MARGWSAIAKSCAATSWISCIKPARTAPNTSSTTPSPRSPPLQYDRHNSSEQKQILARVYAGAGWEIPHLLTAMESAPDFYFDSISLIQLERWSRGRIALLGDAGYCPSPLSGQGTNLALV